MQNNNLVTNFKKGTILKSIEIDKLIFGGNGLAFFNNDKNSKKIIVKGGVIPGAIVDLRVLRNKKNYTEAQYVKTVKKSKLEQKINKKWQVYGGCKWLPIKYEDQLQIKENQIKEAFNYLKINNFLENTEFKDIIPSPETEGYRNKLEFSWGVYISQKEEIHDNFRFGFHKPAEFSRIIDCDYCVLASEKVNNIFKEIDKFSRESGLPTYDPVCHKGFWRHLVIRESKDTGNIMLIFSVNSDYPSDHININQTRGKKKSSIKNKENKENKEIKSTFESSKELISNFIKKLVKKEKFRNITSVFILKNNFLSDNVQGEEIHIYGDKIITDKVCGLNFEISPKSFFQTNTKGAEKLYQEVINSVENIENNNKIDSENIIINQKNKQKNILNNKKDNKKDKIKIGLDLYAGTGTIGALISDKCKKVYSVELNESSSKDGKKNAELNGITNMKFINSKVEDFLPEYNKTGEKADILIIDPPRSGMHPKALELVPEFKANKIIYVSCNPATLVRDSEFLIKEGKYELISITPVDMFPHTHHIEVVAVFEK